MSTFATMMRTAVAAMLLSGSQLQFGGLTVAEARVARLDDFAVRPLTSTLRHSTCKLALLSPRVFQTMPLAATPVFGLS